jgi:hypothetical protein
VESGELSVVFEFCDSISASHLIMSRWCHSKPIQVWNAVQD